MCVAVPGRVISVKGSKAIVDFAGNRIEAEAGLVKVRPGDPVLVHAGCILQVLQEEESDILKDLYEELENL
jgi:hydrogenase expression/formation protein HypC